MMHHNGVPSGDIQVNMAEPLLEQRSKKTTKVNDEELKRQGLPSLDEQTLGVLFLFL